MRRFHKLTGALAALLVMQSVSAAGAFAASASGTEVRIAAASSAPEAKLFVPADDARSVPVNSKLFIRFKDDVKVGNGNIIIKDSKTFSTVAAYEVRDESNVRLSQSRNVVIEPPATTDYKSGADYYVQIDAGAFVGASGGEPYAGIGDTQSWNFHTSSKDTTKPTAISYSPAKGANVSDLGSDLVLKFSEPVIPGDGNIVIRDLSAGVPLQTIPADSSDVSGAGTDTITISHYQSFKPNMVYAVTIDENAFSDLSGNLYKGIASTDISTWRFTTTTDTTPPELVSTSPASGSNYLPLTGAVLKMTFSEPVKIAPGAMGEAIPKTGTTGSVPLTIGPDNASDPDPRVVALYPTQPFAKALQYIIHVPEDAIADAAGNNFPGILNDYRWTLQSIGSDTTAPSLSNATMDGAVIQLTYNEELDENSVPYASNYYVTVNDIPRQVSEVAVSGTQVRLTLLAGVAVGQTVKLSYSVGDKPLQDKSGNKVAAFSNRAVSNTTSTTLPKPTSGTVSGSTITLTFNKTLQTISSNASSQFTVKVNGSSRGISGVTISGTDVVIRLSSNVTTGQSVSVSYTPGSYPLLDLSGNGVAAFAEFYVQNSSDTTPPSLSSATVSGSKVTLNYNEGLDASKVPLKSSFSVLINGKAGTVSSVAVTNNKVELTLSASVASGSVVLVTYIQGYPPISDLAGNAAASVSNYQVVSGSSSAATLSSAVVSGTTLTLTYSSTLNANSVPYAMQFVVKADNGYINVNGVSISGSKVTLMLGAPVQQGQTVTLTYYSSGTPLLDSSNQQVDALNGIAVSNQSNGTTNPSNPGSDVMGVLDPAGATIAAATTPSGQPAKRYVISGEKFVQAYALIKNSGSTAEPQVSFSVPTTEAGALVSIPISSVLNAATVASNGTFRLEYGTVSFTLPLTAINYSQELSLLGGDTSSAQLYLAIEKVADASLNAALSSKGAQLLGSPANFTVSILSSGREREVKSFNSYVTRTFALTAGTASPSEISVVRYDPEYRDVSYVPTTTETTNGTLYVNFKRKSNSVYAAVRKNQQTYSDMTKHWAKSDVSALATKFIVTGPIQSTFAPDKSITRAEFAEFLARGLGLNGDSSSAAKYKDVAGLGTSIAYIGAVSQAGIVQGDSSGKFNPKASITREEMATMMLRAMTYAGVQPSGSSSSLSRFSDRGKVSSWASSAVAANVQAGIMNGVSSSEFKPKANASRAEAAAMVKRFLEYVELFEG
ncbi:hypothetical protein J19TS2_17980 [Cohnella xylanilytica]|uniref:SwmB domain-containing protein n=1 Tax=Cohnella xylanilytica TaxID=557555 RepID=UPI001B004C6B|nr:SwmB domain-containing protein [Cohnella xylanilytica]GIO12243.1 hypothetical protein J19TS2_17980 [Cohnella xylanilytica]